MLCAMPYHCVWFGLPQLHNVHSQVNIFCPTVKCISSYVIMIMHSYTGFIPVDHCYFICLTIICNLQYSTSFQVQDTMSLRAFSVNKQHPPD